MTNNASSVVLRFEVRIGEANKDLFHLVLAEKVGQVSHAVGSVKAHNIEGKQWVNRRRCSTLQHGQ